MVKSPKYNQSFGQIPKQNQNCGKKIRSNIKNMVKILKNRNLGKKNPKFWPKWNQNC